MTTVRLLLGTVAVPVLRDICHFLSYFSVSRQGRRVVKQPSRKGKSLFGWMMTTQIGVCPVTRSIHFAAVLSLHVSLQVSLDLESFPFSQTYDRRHVKC